MFVFSLDDELSFSVIHQYYSRMSQYRNVVDLPVILVAMKGNCYIKVCFDTLTIDLLVAGERGYCHIWAI